MIDHASTKIENLEELSINIERLIALELEKIETLRKLKRTIDLARLVPEVMKSKARTHVIEGNSTFHQWRGASLFVSIEGRDPQVFDLVKDNVPHSLWPAHLLESYQRHLRQQSSNRER